MFVLRRLAATPPFRTPGNYAHNARRLTTSRMLRSRNLSRTLALGTALVTSTLLFGTLYTDHDQTLETTSLQADAETIIDPESGITFPKTLRMTTQAHSPTLTLLAVGVRKVSFLRIKVYAIGFYVDLNSPDLQLNEGMTANEKVERAVRSCACVARIVPTRDTSFTHLRDAFVRAVSARLLLRRKAEQLTEEEAAELGNPLRKLKSLFPNSPLKKHVPLDIFLTPPGQGQQRCLIFRDLGGIDNDDFWRHTTRASSVVKTLGVIPCGSGLSTQSNIVAMPLRERCGILDVLVNSAIYTDFIFELPHQFSQVSLLG